MSKILLLVLLFIFCDLAYGETYYPCSNKTQHKGEAIQIVEVKFDKSSNETNFELNSTGLESILLRQEIRDKELVILSITGDYRKGKSFLLSLLLQSLETGGKGLEKEKIDLDHGFHWRGGSKRVTEGILMWSEPYCVRTKSGKEVAIILMDTQGANDGELSVGETATIFALSFLTSSVQLYNQNKQIQENDLQILKVFAEYGGIITGDREINSKPFQELFFLIRDWPNPQENNFGWEGGNAYLKGIMEIKQEQPEESKQFRHRLGLSFTNITCFLMPYPGEAVAKGKFKPVDIKDIFIENVNKLATILFKPDNLAIKQVTGKNINGKQMFEYFKTNLKILNKNKIKIKDFISAKCVADNMIAFANAKLFHTQQMYTNCSDEFDSIEPNKLRNNYLVARNQTIEQFQKSTIFLTNICGNKYLIDLETWLEEQIDHCSSKNQMKRLENVIKILQNSTEERKRLKYSLESVTQQLENLQKKMNDQQSTINSQQEKINDSNEERKRLNDSLESVTQQLQNQQKKINDFNRDRNAC